MRPTDELWIFMIMAIFIGVISIVSAIIMRTYARQTYERITEITNIVLPLPKMVDSLAIRVSQMENKLLIVMERIGILEGICANNQTEHEK